MTRRLTAALLGALLVLSACGGPEAPRETPAPAPTAAPGATGLPAGDATIRITAPAEGATMSESDVKVAVEVDNFELVDPTTGVEPKSGQGHVVYYVWNGYGDGTYEVPTALGEPANSGGTGYVAAVAAEERYAWHSDFVVPGRQVITVQLANNDFTPLDPPQTARVTVTVTE